MTRAKRFTTAAAGIAIVGLLAIGCSDSSHNPIGSSATAESSNLAIGNGAGFRSPSSTEISGHVATVDASARTLTLTGSTMFITVANNAEVVLKVSSGEDTPITLDQINPGDSVDVRGDVSGSNLTADRVRVRAGEHGPENEAEFRGVITFIDYAGGSFTVDSRTETITTDSLSLFFAHVSRGEAGATLSDGDDDLEGKQQIAFADLKTGDTVEVKGSAIDASTIYAALVKVENNDESGDDNSVNNGGAVEIQFKAMIADINYDTRVITFFDRPDTVTVALDAELTGFVGETVDLNFFGVCFIVEIHGEVTGANQVTATRMKPDNSL